MHGAIRLAALAATLLSTAGVLAVAPFPARAVEVEIDAPRFSLDRETNVYTYEDGRLRVGQLTIFASRFELDAGAARARASGFVRLETPRVFGTAAAVEVDIETRIASFREAYLYVPQRGLYVEAEQVRIEPDGRMEVRHCSFTTCSPGTAAGWSIRASTLELDEPVGLAWNPSLFVGSVPVFWFPVLAWPTVNERRSGVLFPRIAFQRSSLPRFDLGTRIALPVFVNLGVEHDLTLTPEHIENRGTALALEYNYAFAEHQRGRLTLFGIDEQEPRVPAEENDILPPGAAAREDLTPRRFMVDFGHNQRLGDTARLILGYQHSSDGQVRREYRGVTEFRPYRTFLASLADQSPLADYAVTFEQNADYTDESLFADEERFTDLGLRPRLLPRVTSNIGGRPLAAMPLGLRVGLSAARFEADAAVSGQLYTARPTLSLPIALGGAWELRPAVSREFAAYRALTRFDAAAGEEEPLPDASFAQTRVGLELRTVLARVFPRSEGAYDALKHRITPRLVLTELEDVAQPFADQVLRARVAQRLATLRLDNELLGRRRAGATAGPDTPPAGVERLLTVNVIQRYNFLLEADAEPLQGPALLDERQETLPGQPLLPLLVESTINAPGLSLNALVNYHHQLERTTQVRLGAAGATGPRTRLSLDYAFNEFAFVTPDNKLVSAGNTLTVGGGFRFTDSLSASFSGRINLQDDAPPLERRLDRGTVALSYHPGCYTVDLAYRERVTSVLENGQENFFVERQLELTFNLGGFIGLSRVVTTSATEAHGPPVASQGAAPSRCHI